MKVRLLVERATLRGLESPGMVLDVPAAEGKRLIEKGAAEPVRRGRAPENTSGLTERVSGR